MLGKGVKTFSDCLTIYDIIPFYDNPIKLLESSGLILGSHGSL